MKPDVQAIAAAYQDDIYRTALVITKSKEDAEDILQETLLTYMQTDKDFANETNIKAWLLRIAINKSRNLVKTYWNRNTEGISDYLSQISFEEPEDRELVDAVMSLPEKYRELVYLFYYEGYKLKELAQIFSIPENTVKTRMRRGRKMLAKRLKEDW